ncbi:nucleoside triphosphate pyrophosphohydrolase [Paenibacillus sonchi]|uniref:nucleoside triphosphate pyrophosphohydrolase n=1 Tax=Paenibacillus sonchi TaxID=373687 RepID=UPI001E4B0E53|nr:nucleoside triphosphate pyrophosphohydrolase [Paenibacillus sonchi]MCE3198753.1 nucleoside triphosphate pyrophosphohydrolase [Paenibacillus sonchi]
MPIYNKLVRDKIPAIIQSTGKDSNCITLEYESYVSELKKKLREEVEEYNQAAGDAEAVEELSDILEVVHALAQLHKTLPEDLEKIRAKKAEERGGFTDRTFLIEVTE